jgi:hypothetical protein
MDQSVFPSLCFPLVIPILYVPGINRKKEKMPCFPGFFPVIKEVQADALLGITVDRNLP